MSDRRDPEFGFSEDCEQQWRTYLAHFREHVWPMFRELGYQQDTALTVWFVNRLRNTLDDTDAGNEPWKG